MTLRRKTKDKIYEQGRQAYIEGETEEDCPYPIKPRTSMDAGKRQVWFDGFFSIKYHESKYNFKEDK